MLPQMRSKRRMVCKGALGSVCRAVVEELEVRRLLTAAYDWQSAQIGGGGFVSGVVFSPTQKGLAYARTDVGGAYRWDAGAGRWTPLNDFMASPDFNSAGVESIAVDPNDAGKLYMTCGTYGLNSTWGPMGILYRSSDQGRSFARITLPFKVAANNGGRGNGERMMVDPHNSSTLYYGTRAWTNGSGTAYPARLYKSTDSGSTWSVVSSFPSIPTANATGFSFVEFDKNAYTASGTQVIYAGLSQTGVVGPNLYKSTDGGATWSAIGGTGMLPSTTYMPMRESLTPDGSTMYITYGSTAGPGDAWNGGVWKLATGSNVWTKITPTSPSTAATAGYGGVCVDPQSPDTVVVSTLDLYNPRNLVFRSTDGGATWKDLRSNAILDTSSAPYAGGVSPHWGNDIKIDPFNRDHALVISGNGIWSLNDMTTTDGSSSTQPVNHWSFNAQNLEETVVSDLISPSVGPHLLVVHGDYDGFVINDPSVNSAAGAVRYSPAIGSEQRLDFAENAPNIIVRGGGTNALVSVDSGATWTYFANKPAGIKGTGSIAISADGSSIVWAPSFNTGYTPGIYYSTDLGQTWSLSSSAITGGTVVADRSNPRKFYLTSGDANLYVSLDGGATFGSAISAGVSIGSLAATPGIEGDLWMSSSGLYHSTDSGTTWTKVASGKVTGVNCLGFGKAAPGKAYPAMYLYGAVSGYSNKQAFRSDDTGATWVRINDDAHQYVGEVAVISGDPRVYGRVYIGTGLAGGRGTLYADMFSGLISGWTASDIGSPAKAGNSAVGVDASVDSWLMTAGGVGIGGTSDQFQFNRKTITGDASAVVHVDRVDNSDNGASAGIMFRNSTAANAMYAMVAVTSGSGIVFSYRDTTGGMAASIATTVPSFAAWVKLVRTGNSFTAFYATTTGVPASGDWVAIGAAQSVPLSSSALAGLAITSHNASLSTTARFSSVAFGSTPTVAVPASASPSAVTGTTTNLSTLGADADGESSLFYTWVKTSGPGAVAFSANGTNDAKNSTATFTLAGTYTFQVTISDAAGASVTSSVTVVVDQTATTLSVAPGSAVVVPGGTVQLNPTVLDQFGSAMDASAVAWRRASGLGSIDSNGLYTAPPVQTIDQIQASYGALVANARIFVAPAGLKADYGFNEGAGTVAADSAGGNDGLIVGAVYAGGRTGQALSFDGTSDYVDLGSPAALGITGQITLSAWIKPSKISYGSGVMGDIIAHGYSNNPNGEVFLRINNGRYELGSWNGNTYAASYPIPAADLNRWVQLTGVYDGNYWRLYRNGVQVAATGSGIGAVQVNSDWVIGASSVLNRYYQGLIDSLRIYDRGLSPTEVSQLYLQGVAVASPAKASSDPVTGTSTDLIVLGADPDTGSDASLSYNWQFISGPADVTFSVNNSNAAKNTTASFTRAGNYSFQVTITDSGGASATSTTSAMVSQTLTGLVVSPTGLGLPQGSTQQFTAGGLDQFGVTMPALSGVSWSATGGVIDSSGLLTTGAVAGDYSVTATSGALGSSVNYSLWPAAPSAVTFQINDGSAQRSMVTSVTVTFDQPVILAADAISLVARGGWTVPLLAANPSGDGRTYLLTFPDTGRAYGSLNDGVYDLSVAAAQVQDAYGQGLTGGDRTYSFVRLYGDYDGNGRVTSTDYYWFKDTYGLAAGASNYLWFMDYDGNGRITSTDYFWFKAAYGQSLSL